MEATLTYWFWKLVKWGAIFGLAAMVAANPDRAADIVIRIFDFVVSIGMGLFHIVMRIFEHFGRKV